MPVRLRYEEHNSSILYSALHFNFTSDERPKGPRYSVLLDCSSTNANVQENRHP